MKPVATTTDLMCFWHLLTKKRIKICGKPAVPNINNARPKEIASSGFAANLPGPTILPASS